MQPEVAQRKLDMESNSKQAAKARVKPLDDKYMACDPLPDVYNERDITTFMSLWEDKKDTTLLDCIETCQIAENVITSMQEKLGEAESEFDMRTVDWCNEYMAAIRKIELKKWEYVVAHILENIEVHTKLTQDEIE